MEKEKKRSLNEQQQVGVKRFLMKMCISIPMYTTILFLGAGTLKWPAGWVLIGFFVSNQTVISLILFKKKPSLLAERSGLQKGMKSWDRVIAPLAAVVCPLASWVIACLDYRFSWSELGIAGFYVGLGMMLAGMLLADWAMLKNAFFSAVVRIQEDRNQIVVDTGPYRFVRHPGYVGAITSNLGIPLLLGSSWALIPAGISSLLFVIRTALEDRMLRQELAGYPEYAARVRYRLIPGWW